MREFGDGSLYQGYDIISTSQGLLAHSAPWSFRKFPLSVNVESGIDTHGFCGCDEFRFASNKTSTRKYSWWSFLPLALFVQYRRAAYWYFTAMAALSLVPFSPYNPVSVWLPLAFVLGLGLLRELWEDLRRSRGDKEVNSRKILVHDGNGHFIEKQWKDVRVGDIVKVLDGNYFPSDLLLLSSSGPDGICYVETMNLDGETNLKVRFFSILESVSQSV